MPTETRTEGLLGYSSERLTPDELEILHRETPGSNSWERARIRLST
jgi:hypothetical protein